MLSVLRSSTEHHYPAWFTINNLVAMLLTAQSDGTRPKNIITVDRLPTYINKDQIPSKKEPFRAINELQYCHSLDIVTAGDYLQHDLQKAVQQAGDLHYSRVHMKLLDLVSGDFFNDYIKTGNIIMLSEGRTGIDERYTLCEGVLRLEVDRPTFERMGLDGQVITNLGRKHVKARYAVELNLRSPSMLRGKKGFERVLLAFKNVLVNTKTWLFYNAKVPFDFTGPIAAFVPSIWKVQPQVNQCHDISDSMVPINEDSNVDDILDLQEWLSMIALISPRLSINDNMDKYLSRYQTPNSVTESADSTLHTIKLNGFLVASYLSTLFTHISKDRPSKVWVAMTAHGFNGNSYTIIVQGNIVTVCRYSG